MEFATAAFIFIGFCSAFCRADWLDNPAIAMAYEALIVVGFGVSLAVVSVALFVAHVKRINAPNRADPAGIIVHIDLGAALAKDEAAQSRKLASRGSFSRGVDVKPGDSAAVPGAFSLQQNEVGRRRRRRPCQEAETSEGGEEGCQGMVEGDRAISTAEDTTQV